MTKPIDLERPTAADFADDPQKARDAKDAMRTLLQSPGWDLLSQWINTQITARRNKTELVPLESLLDIGKQEYMRGEIGFGRTILDAPTAILEAAELEIELEAERERQLEPELDLEEEKTDA